MAFTRLVLPEFGNDWFSQMRDRYIILSVKHSTKEITMFFKAHCLGYTDCLINAGVFTKTEIIIHLQYYKGDIIAVPLTRDAFTTLGLYPIVADYERIRLFAPKEIAVSHE